MVSITDLLLSARPESEWLEFKENNVDPTRIGEAASALANSATLNRKGLGYLIWGVRDGDRKPVGTKFEPRLAKVGNEPLEAWLAREIRPALLLRFSEHEVDGVRLVVLEVPPATSYPVAFKGTEYVRVGPSTRKLRDYPERERELWKLLGDMPFETGIVKRALAASAVVELLDYDPYFRLLRLDRPSTTEAACARMAEDGLLVASEGLYDITGMGALLFARNMRDFPTLTRRCPRVITYAGMDRTATVRDQPGDVGYAAGFTGLHTYIKSQLPTNEHIRDALRVVEPVYPETAIRELVANALIHQDFAVEGSGPTVEIFSDRLEITNPGEPLVDVDRLLDAPPRSRNERLGQLCRRLGLCEERGSGIDKVVAAVELYQLPPPDFRVANRSTVAVLYAPRDLARLTPAEKSRACYQHACLQYVSGRRMTNASLRGRFKIAARNYATASRLIRRATEDELVKLANPQAGRKFAEYLPFWA